MGVAKRDQLPEKFLERCQEIFGAFYFGKIKETFIKRPPTFRVNTLKSKTDQAVEALKTLGFKLKRASFNRDAFVLENKSQRELSETDLYKEGKIYLQSLGSMVPPLVLGPRPGERVLDLCAAPGSKTSQVAAMMENKGELWAVEIDQVRFEKLKHNMELLGVDEKDFLHLRREDGVKFCLEHQNYFDKILLDAPCGAEARIIADESRTYGFWREEKIKDIAYAQRRLLFSAWSVLKPGGTLVYSTCTFAPEENEEQIDRLLKKFPDEAEVLSADLEGVSKVSAVLEWRGRKFAPQIKNPLRLLPTKEMEGFFIAKIRKI